MDGEADGFLGEKKLLVVVLWRFGGGGRPSSSESSVRSMGVFPRLFCELCEKKEDIVGCVPPELVRFFCEPDIPPETNQAKKEKRVVLWPALWTRSSIVRHRVTRNCHATVTVSFTRLITCSPSLRLLAHAPSSFPRPCPARPSQRTPGYPCQACCMSR